MSKQFDLTTVKDAKKLVGREGIELIEIIADIRKEAGSKGNIPTCAEVHLIEELTLLKRQLQWYESVVSSAIAEVALTKYKTICVNSWRQCLEGAFALNGFVEELVASSDRLLRDEPVQPGELKGRSTALKDPLKKKKVEKFIALEKQVMKTIQKERGV